MDGPLGLRPFIHKRRLLRGSGRGASKPMKGDEYVYLEGFRNDASFKGPSINCVVSKSAIFDPLHVPLLVVFLSKIGNF